MSFVDSFDQVQEMRAELGREFGPPTSPKEIVFEILTLEGYDPFTAGEMYEAFKRDFYESNYRLGLLHTRTSTIRFINSKGTIKSAKGFNCYVTR